MSLTVQQIRGLMAVHDALPINPDTFDMAQWKCGTSMCIAGHYAAYSGIEIFESIGPSRRYTDAFLVMLRAFPRRSTLFELALWPRALSRAYIKTHEAGDRLGMVRAGQAAIRWYIGKHATPEEIAEALGSVHIGQRGQAEYTAVIES